jgi:hypothetical protein
VRATRRRARARVGLGGAAAAESGAATEGMTGGARLSSADAVEAGKRAPLGLAAGWLGRRPVGPARARELAEAAAAC